MQKGNSRTRLWLSVWALALAATAAIAAGGVIEMGTGANPNDCVGCERLGLKFDDRMLAGADFTGANFYKSSFRRANLTGANFTGANLTKVDFRGANLTDALLYGADMTGARLDVAVTTGALTGATTICPDRSSGPCSF